ncbi:BlaI/MecI/CopY family transcriptional regulator [Nonomuraea sp. CA-143628]|uniref:BlaI/MecI/CopY family transcriptional regulator n=1 Tax=Nonomuraea sp. CA-143628 TaxID=3239997 RepID=UPI003D91D872
MDKLYKKCLLKRETVGKAYVYKPVGAKASYTAGLMRETPAGGGNQAATLVHFLERLTPEEAAALGCALEVFPSRTRRS